MSSLTSDGTVESDQPDEQFTFLLPDGRRMTLTKPWEHYSVAEFRALGLLPDMSPDGTATTVSFFIPFSDE